jgi:hypothetical protein
MIAASLQGGDLVVASLTTDNLATDPCSGALALRASVARPSWQQFYFGFYYYYAFAPAVGRGRAPGRFCPG